MGTYFSFKSIEPEVGDEECECEEPFLKISRKSCSAEDWKDGVCQRCGGSVLWWQVECFSAIKQSGLADKMIAGKRICRGSDWRLKKVRGNGLEDNKAVLCREGLYERKPLLGDSDLVLERRRVPFLFRDLVDGVIKWLKKIFGRNV